MTFATPLHKVDIMVNHDQTHFHVLSGLSPQTWQRSIKI